MQVGVAKVEGQLVSLSLDGDFNFWDDSKFKDDAVEEIIAVPDSVAHGHRKSVVASNMTAGILTTVDVEGKISIEKSLIHSSIKNF